MYFYTWLDNSKFSFILTPLYLEAELFLLVSKVAGRCPHQSHSHRADDRSKSRRRSSWRTTTKTQHYIGTLVKHASAAPPRSSLKMHICKRFISHFYYFAFSFHRSRFWLLVFCHWEEQLNPKKTLFFFRGYQRLQSLPKLELKLPHKLIIHHYCGSESS